MKSIDVRPDFDGKEFTKSLLADFIPEMRRISQQKNIPLFDDKNPEKITNITTFIMTLGFMPDIAGVKYFKKTGKRSVLVRIEMQTFDDSVIRFRFVPMDDKREPLLEEKENPLLLFLPTPKDMERFHREGYTYIAYIDFLAPPQE